MSLSLVLFLSRLWREENLSDISQYSSAVVVSLGVVGHRVAQTICRSTSRIAVLANITSALIPLVGGLVDNSQEEMEEGVTGKQKEDKDQKPQHEHDSRERQEQVLE